MTTKTPLQAWVRALERTAGIGRNPQLTLPAQIDQLAQAHEQAPAFTSQHGTLTYRSLATLCNQYARWGLASGLGPGKVVCLLMPNSVEYMAIWLGLTRIGVTVALLNTNLRGPLLTHSINVVAPRYVIAHASLCEPLLAVRAQVPASVQHLAHGPGGPPELERLDQQVALMPAESLAEGEYQPPSLEDRALYIYTSGTTGLPKAANVSHHRLMQWSQWFAGMMDIQPGDRMYDCLPLYHSVGGVVATGATLVGGGTVIVRERFSASDFWRDVVAERCTLFQYIGELCRYLMGTAPHPDESGHQLRLCCGNGLRPEVWEPFVQRFKIPQILEYYAATEGSFSLYNCEGRVGSIGRIPPFLRHRMPVALVRFDVTTGEPMRDAEGRCVRCTPGEVGEALGQIAGATGDANGRFEGYADRTASERKILRDVFTPGDAWFRTGDLMRQDAQGYFYFMDRIGDTFRWKGENVSTTEVNGVVSACPGVVAAAVYGVAIPGADGRAGMAAVAVNEQFSVGVLRQHLAASLPDYARPLFLRIVTQIEVTETFKLKKNELASQGYDPARTTGELYVEDRQQGAYVRLDLATYERIQAGQVRL
jgi:fatty-acyl-CoA synthase